MVAGRGLAQLITDGQIITINSEPYQAIGLGYWLTLPFAIFIAARRGRCWSPRSPGAPRSA